MDTEAEARIQRDLVRIVIVQALRAFLYGFGVVILGSALATTAISTSAIATAMLAGMALAALAVGFVGDRFGRRRLYSVLLALMGGAGTVFALTSNVWALVLVSLTGTMSTDPNESGPITTLEQAMIGQAPAAARGRVFGRYNAVAYLAGAVGGLAAGGPSFLRDVWHGAPTDKRWLLVFPVGAAICVSIARRLSPVVEPEGTSVPERPLRRSRGTVVRLSSLFAVDAFAGGFVVQLLIVTWFHSKFGVGPKYMSVVAFAWGLLQAGSSILAARAGAKLGLLNTMVLSHFPSNVLLLLVPFMPTLALATAVLLARFALSQMDVPTRQAYIAAMVDPEERTAAAAFTNTSRYVARPFGPTVGTALTRAFGLGAPFIVAGALKSAYDLVLWRMFRRVRLPD